MTTPPKTLAPSVDPTALRHALSVPGYRERRIALRSLVQPVLEQMFTKDDVVCMLESSLLVGPGEKQISVRSQISGLRDQFDETTLIALAYGGAWLPILSFGRYDTTLEQLKTAIISAIVAADSCAMPSTSSKTGFVFGRHVGMTDSFARAMREKIAALTPTPFPTPTTEKPKTMTKTETTSALPHDTTLDHLMRMLDHVAIAGRVNYDAALVALRSVMRTTDDADRFDAAFEMASMRVWQPTSLDDLSPLAKDHAAVARSALATLAGDPITAAAAVLVPGTVTVSVTAAGSSSTITTTKEGTPIMTDTLPKVDPTVASMIDAMLSSAKLPPLTGLMDRINVQTRRLESMLHERAELERKLAEAESRPAAPTSSAASHDGVIPAGKASWVPAHEAFGLAKGKDAFAFKVPVWTWEGVHPHVPQVDTHYVFRPFELMRVLYGIVANKRVYLHGHTGTGKTTLIEQVAARLRYPFMRLNFDSEISRMDLIGRDTLASEGGTTVSRFVDGILPQMMQSPCLGCFDEIDFVRPDIAYVMQRMLEGDSLVITEDGGRVVKPHPMFRAFATGNTVGQGDEHGMYQGARVQSTALLDRFSVWQRIDYLKPEDRDSLIKNRVPGLSDELRSKLNKYVTEHLQAFTTSKVLQPLSPRGFLGLADALVFFTSVVPNKRDAVQQALESTILDRASVQDRVVLKGLADRVFA